MRNVFGSAEQNCGRKSIPALLLAMAVALLVPSFGQSFVMAQEETPPAADAAAAPPAAPAEAAAPADPSATPAAEAAPADAQPSRSFLAYIARACGWFEVLEAISYGETRFLRADVIPFLLAICRELSSGILNSSDYGRTAARMRRGRRVPPEFR